MSYARARLWVGISGVGIVVVLSVLALRFGWANSLLPTTTSSPGRDVLALAAVLLAHAAILAPFDLLGGYVLPRRFGRSGVSLRTFLGGWLRGISVQLGIVLLSAVVVLSAGRVGGLFGAAAAFAVVMVLLVICQWAIASLMANLVETDRQADVSFIRSGDPGFTGGVVGVPGRERFLVPRQWLEVLQVEGVAVELARWNAMLTARGRILGLSVAFGWNLVGFLVAAQLPAAGVDTVAGLVTLALGFTLWSFLGLLLLPSLSRPAVHVADRLARESVRPVVLERTLRRLDRQQDDEPERAATIETIFHPIPSVARRVESLYADDGPRFGAWHAARTALFLSWAGLGMLSRAVHCNSGRPELWALLPCD